MKNRSATILVALVIIILVGAAIYMNYGLSSTMHTMNLIEGRMKGSGTFVDYDRSIEVTSADDLGWWKTGEDWHIMYGKLELKFTPEQLRDEKFLAQVKKIGIDIRGNLEEGSLSFYWFGTKLKEWVPQ